MTREEFIARWRDEVNGQKLACFAENEASTGKFDQKGRYMVNELRKTPDLLGRIYDSLQPKGAGAAKTDNPR